MFDHEVDNIIQEVEDFSCDAPKSMTAFQIEKFIVNQEPPIGRYHKCCTEISSRKEALSRLRNPVTYQEKEQLQSLLSELKIFIQLAKKWKPLTEGKSHEELQNEYWDQKLGKDVGIRILMGQSFGDLLPLVMQLDDNSKTKKILENMNNSNIQYDDIQLLIGN